MFLLIKGKGEDAAKFEAMGLRALHRVREGENWQFYFELETGRVPAEKAIAAAKKLGVEPELVPDSEAASKPVYVSAEAKGVVLSLTLPAGTVYDPADDGTLVIGASASLTNGREETVSFESDRAMPFELVAGSISGGELLVLEGEPLPKAKRTEIAPGSTLTADFKVHANDFHGNLVLSVRTVLKVTDGLPNLSTPPVRLTVI